MNPLSLLSLLVMGLTSSALAAQTTLYLDDPYALPVIDTNSGSVDHVVVAVNPLGDILVVFHENVNSAACGGGTTSRVSAVFIPKAIESNGAEWLIPSSAELVGDPCQGDGGSRTRCEKPQVAAVGDSNNFLIVYSRDLVTDTPTTSKLESVPVQVTVETSGYNTTTYHYGSNAGEGYVLASGYEEGSSGGNVGLAHYTAGGTLPESDGALAVFLHQPGSAGSYRLFAVYADYTANGIGGDPDVIVLDDNTNSYLISGITSDNDASYGDRWNVAPFVIEDDNGFLVLAYDEWFDTTTDFGWVVVQSYTYNANDGTTTLWDTKEFQGGSTSWHHRRPVLAKTLLDSDPYLGLSWSNYENGVTDPPSDIDWRKIEVDDTTTTYGEITQVSDYSTTESDVQHARAIYAYKGTSTGTPLTLEAVLYHNRTNSTPSTRSIWYLTSSSTDTRVDEATSSNDTDRPAYAVWNNGSEHYLIMVWDQLVSTKPRPFIKIVQIG